jgi:dTDP-4-amino-4,6-dideoxygalactose transaminase
MLNTAQSPWPSYTEEEIDEVAAVLRSNRVNQWTGDQIKLFEREFAEWCGVEHAIAVSNGTLALDLALKCLDIGPGDEVIVTPRTFIASVSSVITAGARPVFADVDPDSGNITAATILPFVNERTKAVIPVHLAGWPVDVPELTTKLAGTGIAVIEDCAQAHGAQVDGQSVGSLGTIGAWSFCQDKIMTTGGEGGMVTCDDAGLWDRMWSYKDHGKNWDAVFNRAHAPGFRWVHDSFGTNWRMLEMQAAIGRIQLRRMKQWTARRTAIATRYAEALAPFASALRVPLPRPGLVHGFYRLYAYVRADGLKPSWSRDRIVEEVTRLGVPLYQGSCSEVYLEKAFDGTDFRPAQRLPAALGLGATSLMFLVHPSLRDDEVEQACQVFAQVLETAAR